MRQVPKAALANRALRRMITSFYIF